jgi:SAM-dependent methyltransferase
LPLAAWKYLGWPLSASLQRRDGYEPEELYRALGWVERWSEPLRSLVTLPYLLSKGNEGEVSRAIDLRQPPEVAGQVLRGTLHRLHKALDYLQPRHHKTRWSDYPMEASHYSQEEHVRKQAFVRKSFLRTAPHRVLDLGANTGNYSRIAAEAGAQVVAWDTDLEAAEKNWRQACEEGLSIQVLVADVARPTPAAGWRYREAKSLLERSSGRFDCLMMLGLIHHLLLSEQIPMEEVVELVAQLTSHTAIVEWIPQHDPRFRDLLRGRDHIYGHLTEENFEIAFRKSFSILEIEELGNGRRLYLLEKHR